MKTVAQFFVLVLVLVAGGALPAAADSCECSYGGGEGVLNCSASITCERELANCTCNSSGCTATCGRPGLKIDDFDLPSFKTWNANVHALGDWLASLEADGAGWTATAPATTPDLRITREWTETTISSLVKDWAEAFGVSARIDWASRTIEFRPVGGFGPRKPGPTPR